VPRSRRLGRSRFTLVLLILASLTILTLDYRDSGPVKGAQRAVGTIFSPFRAAGEWVGRPIGDAWNGIFGYGDLEDENRRLRDEIDELRGRDLEERAAREEVDELRDMLDLRDASDIEMVVAEVISGGLTSFETTIEINRGSGDGIREGMAVRTPAGLVGQVERVEGGRARVRLITDPEFAGVGVKLVEARDVGFATGGGPDGTLVVEEGITLATPVEKGDVVVTSGYDRSNYPGGIPVGTVYSVGRTADLTEQTLVIEPSADLEGLGFVAVLLCDQDCG